MGNVIMSLAIRSSLQYLTVILDLKASLTFSVLVLFLDFCFSLKFHY